MAFQIKPREGAPYYIAKSKPVKGLDWTDRVFVERPGAVRIECKWCSGPFFVPPSKVGQKSTCSRDCHIASIAKDARVPAWADRIFEARETTLEKACGSCGVTMHLPPSKLKRVFCSRACQQEQRREAAKAQTKPCLTCGAEFRSIHGRFCSQACNTAGRAALSSPEAMARAAQRRKDGFAEGWISRPPKGESHPKWKGGAKGRVKRYTESGAAAAARRAYRKANPEKVREFSTRRTARKLLTGRLPRGTVKKIFKAQKSKCAVCRIFLRGEYHLDHIMPLARGGTHEPKNLQVLCPPCNVKKSAKDPIDFMQSLGRLL